ncbi:hypothetical protein [Streptomyces sp. NPDC057238]|uniref:hypothetical protein n=1 Tax=Streptomyces sp. NPDC057238 TaxID=3346060 RepID=UPI003629AE73
MSRNGKRARTALTVALAWVAAGGTAVAGTGTGTGAVLPWGGGRAATAVALQAAAQELAAWEAGQDAAYEAAVRKAVSDAEKWRAAAATAAAGASTGSGAGGQSSAAQAQDQDQDQVQDQGREATADHGSGQAQGTDWGARIKEALETPHPRPESTPGTDPEHQQRVEDAYTDPVKDLTYEPAP